MSRQSLLGPLRHERWGSAAAAALGGPVIAGDDDLRPGRGQDHRAGSRAGAGAAQLPGRAVATGLSDAGAPTRPETRPLAADLLTAESAASGFTAYWVGVQLRLMHDCHDVTGVDRATREMVGWHVRTHRCGPPGSAWHLRDAPSPLQGHDPTRPAHMRGTGGGRRDRN
jgi:hypothetical protein